VKLRVLTYNVWGLPSPLTTGSLARFKQIKEEIGAYDVVVLQEVFGLQVRDQILKSAFPFKSFARHARLIPFFNRIGTGLVILSKFPIIRTSRLRFNPFRATDFDRFALKGALHSRILLPNQSTLDLFTTHLQAEEGPLPEKIRIYQLRRLAKFIKQHHRKDHSWILAGDFNSTPNSPSHREIFRELQLTDALEVYCHKNPLLPQNSFMTYSNENDWLSNDSNRINKRIDYIFFQNGRLNSLDVENVKLAFNRSRCLGKHLSDHFGVEALFHVHTNEAPGGIHEA